jgi:Ni,Fe-hydrogenase maturation factor
MWKFQVTELIAVNARTSRTDFLFNPPEPNRIIVVDAQPFDSGNYRCVARNDYSQAFAAEVISVEGLSSFYN